MNYPNQIVVFVSNRNSDGNNKQKEDANSANRATTAGIRADVEIAERRFESMLLQLDVTKPEALPEERCCARWSLDHLTRFRVFHEQQMRNRDDSELVGQVQEPSATEGCPDPSLHQRCVGSWRCQLQ
jgi:hypothetical protein